MISYRGTIFKIPYPYTDLSSIKVRPALAISDPDDNGDVEFLFITSKNNFGESDCLKLTKNVFLKGELPLESYLVYKKSFLLAKNNIMDKICVLKDNVLCSIIRKLNSIKVEQFYQVSFKDTKFQRGKDIIRYAGRVFDEKEIINLVDSSLDFWLTEGRFAEDFAGKISDFLDMSNVILTNSGSSANLLAFSALTSKKLGDKRLKSNDEVISVAACFPATITPIIQYGLIPVFVDVDLRTYNINIEMLKRAITSRTKCIFLAHTLGNPFDLDEVVGLCKKNNLWLIEDNCDAFGSKYNDQYTGTFGDISTMSFYPAHHITTGEGGAVVTNNGELAKIVKSFRDWGRDCYCNSGENNTCGKRFTQQFGRLPLGYDHKYVYSEIGYNLKMTDMQAAIGSAQMDKLEYFTDKRRENFKKYHKIFSKYDEYFILPEATEKSDPSWFSFIVTLKDNIPFNRDELIKNLNENLIETRYLFAGNITRQPCFEDADYRIAEHLDNTDYIMNNTFFLGTYPGLTEEMFVYVEKVVDEFMKYYI